MGLTLAVDFGSTFTKVAALDLDKEELIGAAKSASTVDTDIMKGLNQALENLKEELGVTNLDIEHVLSSSSAAGGLRMVVAGLVNELTTKAAKEAALGAGAKVVATYANGISPEEMKEIEQSAPDLVLLTGGTDGGNKEVILQNAEILASSRIDAPVVIAGNKMAAQQAQLLLEKAGKYAVSTENVLPELYKLNIEPARAAIRNIFMQRITRAKGLEKAEAFVGRTIIPTPMAVLKGAGLLADGTEDEEGMGELIVVDVGGATTDVFSIAHGEPSKQDVTFKGLPEPYAKRTVEGDLGIRYNAQFILHIAGSKKMIEKAQIISEITLESEKLAEAVNYLSHNIDVIPQSEEDVLIDTLLASTAVNIATRRHAGLIEDVYYPSGKIRIQHGKDLTGVKYVIGTGGILASGREPYLILQSACLNSNNPESLRPLSPGFFIDASYILYAAGLLAGVSPSKALRIIKKNLRQL